MSEKSSNQPETTFYRTNIMGEIELVDMMTGHVQVLRKIHEYDKSKYTLEMSEVVCDLVRRGHTLTKISQMEGMPSSSVMFRWRQLHPDFQAKLDAAKQDRAEYFHDKVLETLDNLDNVEDKRAAMESLRVQGLKWLAEVGNPDKYGKRTKVTGDATAPITFVLDTGVRKTSSIKHELPGPSNDQLQIEQNAIIESTHATIAPNALSSDLCFQKDDLPSADDDIEE